VLVATTVVNLRYVLFASTLSPHLRRTSMPLQALLAFSLTDETFAVNIADRRAGLSTPASMVASCGGVDRLGARHAHRGCRRDLDRRPGTFRRGLRDAGDVRRAVRRTRRGLAPRGRRAVAGAIVLGLPLLGSLGLRLDPSWYLVSRLMSAAAVGAASGVKA